MTEEAAAVPLKAQIQALRNELERLQARLQKLEWREHAEHCAAEVAKWPEWKRNVLGQCQAPSLSVKRPPVRQEPDTPRRQTGMTTEELNAMRAFVGNAEKLQRQCKQFDEAISAVQSPNVSVLAIRPPGSYPTESVLAYAYKEPGEEPRRPVLLGLLTFVDDPYSEGLAAELQQAVLDVLLRRRAILNDRLAALQYTPSTGN